MGDYTLWEIIKHKSDSFNLEKLSLIKELAEGDFLIDVGSGVGAVTTELAKVRKFVGIEVSIDKVNLAKDLARKRGVAENTEFVVADASRLPFVDCAFSGAICSHLLEHLRDPMSVLLEIHRVVCASSVLVVAVPTLIWEINQALRRLRGSIFHGAKYPSFLLESHVNRWLPWEWEKLLRNSGFNLEKSFGHHFSIFRRRAIGIFPPASTTLPLRYSGMGLVIKCRKGT